MVDLRDDLELGQVAARLAIPASKLRALIRTGEVVAARRAGRWFVPVAEVRRCEQVARPSGRPFSVPAAWALLALLAGQDVDLPAPRRSQLRRRLREEDLGELAGRLRHRARRQLAFVHPGALEAVAADPRLLRSGWQAADQLEIGLVSAGDEPLEGYLAERDVAGLRQAYGVVEADQAANLVLRIVDDEVAVPQADGVVAPPVLGLDLLESGDPRGIDVGRRLFANAIEAVRAS